MKVELRQHPAQADHPLTGEKLFIDGKPVPLLPDHRGIFLDGVCVGYVGDGPLRNVMFIHHLAGENEWVRTQVRILVESEFKTAPAKVVNVPPPPVAEAAAANTAEDYEDAD